MNKRITYEGFCDLRWTEIWRLVESLQNELDQTNPVAPEELTRKKLDEMIEVWNIPRIDELFLDALFSRIIQDRAATEARVRAECLEGSRLSREKREQEITSLRNTNTELTSKLETKMVTSAQLSAACTQYATRIETLLNTIAELEKRLENAVEIDWDKAPVESLGVVMDWTDWTEERWLDRVHDELWRIQYIPRPTPAKLTPEKMAEAVCHAILAEMGEGYTADDAHDMLFKELLDGKSIETLYAEIGKGGAK